MYARANPSVLNRSAVSARRAGTRTPQSTGWRTRALEMPRAAAAATSSIAPGTTRANFSTEIQLMSIKTPPSWLDPSVVSHHVV